MSTWGDWSFMQYPETHLSVRALREAREMAAHKRREEWDRLYPEKLRDHDRERRTQEFLKALGYSYQLPEAPKPQKPQLRVIKGGKA